MTRRQIMEKAREVGLNEMDGIRLRMSALREQIAIQRAYIEQMEIELEEGNELTRCFLQHTINRAKEKISRMQREHSMIVIPNHMIKGITDDDIEKAKQYPIEKLIESRKGNRCIAFCHDSDSYSMGINTKSNRLHCFVCNKSFNPIDVLVMRDGYTFIEAVRRLS